MYLKIYIQEGNCGIIGSFEFEKQAEKLISCKYYKHNSKRSDISKRTNRSKTPDIPENSDRKSERLSRKS